jgi:hypothetical protein
MMMRLWRWMVVWYLVDWWGWARPSNHISIAVNDTAFAVAARLLSAVIITDAFSVAVATRWAP